jgi:DedD protein
MADSSSRNQAADPALPEKKRGRRRLVGAAVFLAGAAVIASLVFDHEPKPATPELALKIPARDKSPVEQPVAEKSSEKPATDQAGATPAQIPLPVAVPNAPAATPAVPKQDSTLVDPPKIEAPKAEAPKVEVPKLEAPKQEVAKAEAKTKDKDPLATLSREANAGKATAAAGSGFMVQIGAFSSEEKLSAAVAKAKEAGYKVVTETVKTTNGERTRVRVGPFKSRESANAARTKLKEQGLEPALIAL